MASEDDADQLEYDALTLLAERGMARIREFSRRMLETRDAKLCERLSREYEREHRRVLKDIEAAGVLSLRMRRRRGARPTRVVPRMIEGQSVH